MVWKISCENIYFWHSPNVTAILSALCLVQSAQQLSFSCPALMFCKCQITGAHGHVGLKNEVQTDILLVHCYLEAVSAAADNGNLICSQQYSFPACYVISTNCNSISKRLDTGSIFHINCTLAGVFSPLSKIVVCDCHRHKKKKKKKSFPKYIQSSQLWMGYLNIHSLLPVLF